MTRVLMTLPIVGEYGLVDTIKVEATNSLPPRYIVSDDRGAMEFDTYRAAFNEAYRRGGWDVKVVIEDFSETVRND